MLKVGHLMNLDHPTFLRDFPYYSQEINADLHQYIACNFAKPHSNVHSLIHTKFKLYIFVQFISLKMTLVA